MVASTPGTGTATRWQGSPPGGRPLSRRLPADVRPAGRERSQPRGGRRGPPGTRRLTYTGGHERTFDRRPTTGRPCSTGLPLVLPLVLRGLEETRRTPGDRSAGQRPIGPAQTRSGDLRHLRGHRADPAARDRPGDLGDAHRAAHAVETGTRTRGVASSWGAGASRDDVRLGFRLGSDDSLAGDEERFGEVAWS
jgi:hypothetical protein